MKVAAYCRVSTDKSDQVNSFEGQQRYFREYIAQHDDWELYEIYADEGVTGTSTKKRTAFNRMISDARLDYRSAPHLIIVPGLCIFLLLFALNLLGDALRDHFDVRSREVKEL